ncbi:hypothetical protein GEV33_012592 [Tenebrio molitor]|uniref:Uncharacterized protein n=1 Tax=Tenebrio molitor TaxID=7067 RepID=A0A8J6L8Z5_TENMO|nr:hypothetical protein GEV33_012592 [Tenebrio molitor]
MLSRFIKSTPNKKDETTDGCTRERRPYNLKELEFATEESRKNNDKKKRNAECEHRMCTEVVSGERRTTKWERKSFQEVFVEHRGSVERTTRRNEMSEGQERAECPNVEEEERQERNEKDGKVQNGKKRVILPERFGGSLWNVDGDRSPTAQERGGNLIYGQQQTL